MSHMEPCPSKRVSRLYCGDNELSAGQGGGQTPLTCCYTETTLRDVQSAASAIGEVVPNLRRLAIVANVDNPAVVLGMSEVQSTAKMLGLEVTALEVRRAEDIAPALESLKGRADALYVASDPLLFTNRIRVNTLALGARLPTMHDFRDYVEVGGLMSYGPNIANLFRRAADYVDKILRGAKPSEIPVEQPTKFDLVINLTTSKALGLTIPESFLLRADEVIE
jgi:putative tryptophan/tyrosine transport system substrate-binding protein